MNDMPAKLLSPRDLAKLLQVSMLSVTSWRRVDSRRPAHAPRVGPEWIRVGNKIRYDPRDIEQWLADKRSASSSGRAQTVSEAGRTEQQPAA